MLLSNSFAFVAPAAPTISFGSKHQPPRHAALVQPEIQRPEQLQGKTLAITCFGSTSDFVTRLVPRKHNFEGKTELRQFGDRGESKVGLPFHCCVAPSHDFPHGARRNSDRLATIICDKTLNESRKRLTQAAPSRRQFPPGKPDRVLPIPWPLVKSNFRVRLCRIPPKPEETYRRGPCPPPGAPSNWANRPRSRPTAQ